MPIYTLGIDVGSTASKCVILKDGVQICARSLIPVGTGTSGPRRAIQGVLERSGLELADIGCVVATGYGRKTLTEYADLQLSELSCHARGAEFLFPGVRTVIDIGGQDVKVLETRDGALINFAMNDKCAAGTGRFLDVMARALEVEVGELAELGRRSTVRLSISSTCTVFAESEVISQLSAGADRCDIINGIHRSVAAKVVGLARRVGVREPVVMTGGVARNAGVAEALAEELDCPVQTSPLAQYVGALGAALAAWQWCRMGAMKKHEIGGSS